MRTSEQTTSANPPGVENTTVDATKREVVLKEIGAKWGKLSEQDLVGLKSRDDLVSQVMAKYGLEKPGVQRDVDALLKGRQV